MRNDKKKSKPPYKIPTMRSIAKIPANGYSVVSTFSGCGGSCLGFEMVGFKILWASEFVAAARETYKANHPKVVLDARDIRNVKPADILKSIGLRKGQLDVLEGSPPCASFSTAGQTNRTWGQVKKYSATRQRTDDLFFEYGRILKGLQPKIFIAENVSGLVKGVAKGYFKEILNFLKLCGYTVSARLLDAQWLGVPQMRQRIIFMGIRKDLKMNPEFPAPLPYRYSVREAIPYIFEQMRARGFNKDGKWVSAKRMPSQTIGPTVVSGCGKGNPSNIRVIHDAGGKAKEYNLGDVTKRPTPTITAQGVGHLKIETNVPTSKAGGISNYLWDEARKLRPGQASKKHFSLVRAHPKRPSPTICATVASASTASVIHPTEMRKFTIEELKCVCSFPEDFVLTGSYNQQWERLGRAVPSLMMFRIAVEIRKLLDKNAGLK